MKFEKKRQASTCTVLPPVNFASSRTPELAGTCGQAVENGKEGSEECAGPAIRAEQPDVERQIEYCLRPDGKNRGVLRLTVKREQNIMQQTLERSKARQRLRGKLKIPCRDQDQLQQILRDRAVFRDQNALRGNRQIGRGLVLCCDQGAHPDCCRSHCPYQSLQSHDMHYDYV